MKKYLGFILLAITTASLTSCLKDGPVNLPPGGSPPVIEFSTNLFASPTSDVNSPVAVYTKSYDIAPSVDMEVTIGYTGGAPAPQDITVNFDTEGQDKIDAYNEYSENEYELIPSTLFTLPTSAVIKKGENFAKFTVKLKTAQFDFSKSYILPLHITSVSSGTISGNYGTILVAVGAKNKYDGIYEATGTMVDNTVPAITGRYPSTYYVNTITATKNALFDPNFFGDYIHLILNAGATSGYGTFSPQFTFDDNGNITAVVNFKGQPAPNGRSAQLDPTGQNKYIGTPGTVGSKFVVKYFMLQPGSTIRTTFDETFTFKGPRP
jgi:predicted small lipoprotein YifL